MAQQEQYGSNRDSEAGSRTEAEERAESLWSPPADDPEERAESLWDPPADDPEEFGGAVVDSRPTALSPREQWFGGFEGAAPPPPPYARLPEDTPFSAPGDESRAVSSVDGGRDEPVDEGGGAREEEAPGPWLPELPMPSGPSGALGPSEGTNPSGSSGPDGGFRTSEAVEETGPPEGDADAGTDDTADIDDVEDDMRGSTVRLLPGASRRRPERPQRQRLQRPTRPGGNPDPLAPRRSRHDSDVPEPEQLPPLESDRGEGFPEEERSDPTPVAPVRSHPEPPRTLTGPRADLAPPVPPIPEAPPSTEVSTVRLGPETPSVPAIRPSTDREPVRRNVDQERETADSLNAATLVRNRRQGPSGGWRRAVHTASLGLINPGESPKVLRQRELVARACTPVANGHHRVAVLSLKGGVGKTTTTVALGATLASLRGDRVLAVDANPDRGTLSDKVRLETAATIRDLLNERHLVSRYADIRGFTSQAPSRLEILASDRDPAVSEAFSDTDYREVARIVEHFYSICLTDCGTGLLHSAMRGVLGLADQVVLVSSASVDGARSASATLDWLEAHGHGSLVRSAVVVLSMVRSNSKSSVDLNRLEEHFAGRCRDVVRIPWDGHLEEGAEVDLEQLAPATRDAYLQLAASVGEAFARHR